MQCLILAGGLGTRIRSVAGDTPKALLPATTVAADKDKVPTFIDLQLQWLKLLGADDVVMALGHGGEIIQTHIEKKKSAAYPKVQYSFDGPKLLGTGGAIKQAHKLLADDFIVAYGDSFLFLNLEKLMQSHVQAGEPLTFSIFKNENKGDKSNILFKNGRILRYDKFSPTPDMDYIDYGMSVVNKKYFLAETPGGVFDFADFLAKTCERGRVNPYVARDIFQEIGSPEGYRNFCKLMEGAKFDLKALAHSRSLL